jgi:glutathione synthase/RimK-type ligase-like ATP-grasp enzyme
MKTSRTLAIVSSNHRSAAVADLTRVATEQGWSVSLTSPDADDTELVIGAAQRVIFRVSPKNHPTYEVLFRKISGVFHDQLGCILRSFDKLETHKILAEHHIDTPRTWVIDSKMHFEEKKFVIKIRRGNQGLGVSLIEDDTALQAFFAEYPEDTFFIGQEFIAEAVSGDKRLFVVGDTVVASMRRQSNTDDFRANIHLGGEASAYIPTQH